MSSTERSGGGPLPAGHTTIHPPISAGWYFWNGCMFDRAAQPEAWLPLPDAAPAPAAAELDAEYERGRKAGITQCYDAVQQSEGGQPPAALYRALLQQAAALAGAAALSDAQIIEIRDEHLPGQGASFDCLAFARAIEAAAFARPRLLPWRHVRSGAVYDILAHAKMEATGAPVVVYRGESGTWVRPALEFYDGRFERAES